MNEGSRAEMDDALRPAELNGCYRGGVIEGSRGRRARKRRKPKALKQGDLDGLCGVYSVVNAIRLLCPEIDGAAAWWLFGCLMQELENVGVKPEAVITDGLWRLPLQRLLKVATRKVADEYDVVLRIARVPKLLRHTNRLAVLWDWLAENVSASSVVILALGGRFSHWTVASNITSRRICLHDSCEMKFLHRRMCTVGQAANRFSISPAWIFVVSRQMSPVHQMLPHS